ncbi:organic solute transporter Ostalpha-domain-containing protein [Glomus cerebriforme]|uniref:Organic solute transporter Ostalpha-domain-containing protein n=1 Tax=Glomus cerebriforme TaxID=658196 RepID=A0A397TAP6_9GLOM|nr:organic solute transporter Ostalpha-domain-containing protein [Glomus cerebriforme]
MDYLTNKTCPRVQSTRELSLFDQSSGNLFVVHTIGWITASLFTFLSCMLTFWLMYQHIKHYTKPEEQRLIVRLLMMVPVYTVFDLLSSFFLKQSVYFTTIRDAYQAASVLAFFNLLLEYLGSSESIRIIKFSRISSTPAPFPFCCFTFNPSKHRILLQGLKLGVLQYVFILYLTIFVAVILQFLGIYCKESWSIYFPQIHLVLVQTISSLTANFCLNFFFQAVKEDLARYQLVLKDICINWALFFVTYQEHALAIAVFAGLIKPNDYLTADSISTSIQSVLVAIEFFFISILQLRAFSAKEYILTTGTSIDNSIPYTTLEVLLDALNPIDTINDLIYVVGFIFVHIILRRPEPVQPSHKVRRLSSVRSSSISLPMRRTGTDSDIIPMISIVDLSDNGKTDDNKYGNVSKME